MNYDARDNRSGLIRILIFLTAGCIAGTLAARFFIVPFKITDNSLEPTYVKGTRLFFLKTKTPKIGDLVLFASPFDDSKVYIKRVIAQEDDTIELKSKRIYINGTIFRHKLIKNSKDKNILPLSFSKRDTMPPVRLKHKEYFVLGDSLDKSFDSRYFGPIRNESIIGTLVYSR